jgi:uncharacterized membrane-anchored protein
VIPYATFTMENSTMNTPDLSPNHPAPHHSLSEKKAWELWRRMEELSSWLWCTYYYEFLDRCDGTKPSLDSDANPT